MNERFETIAEQLDQLAEELSEIAIDELKAAVRSGASRTTAQERKITQARRAVEKAAHLLRTLDNDDPGGR